MRLKHTLVLGNGINRNINVLILHGVRQTSVANPILTTAAVSHRLCGINREIACEGRNIYLMLVGIIACEMLLSCAHRIVGCLVRINVSSLNSLTVGRGIKECGCESKAVCQCQWPEINQLKIIKEGIAKELILLKIINRIVNYLGIGEGLHAHLHQDLVNVLTNEAVFNKLVKSDAVRGLDNLLLCGVVKDRLNNLGNLINRLTVHLGTVHALKAYEEAVINLLVIVSVFKNKIYVRTKAVACIVAGLIVHIHSSAGGHECILGITLRIGVFIGLCCNVNPNNVHYDLHLINHEAILASGELNEVCHGGNILGIIVIGIILAEAVVISLLHPSRDALLRHLEMLLTALAVGKNRIRPCHTNEILGGGEHNLVILAPMAHAVGTSVILIHPVLEACEACLDFFLIHVGETMLVLNIESDKSACGEIGAILTDVNALNSALKVLRDQSGVKEVGILKALVHEEHFCELSVTTLRGLKLLWLNKDHIVGKLQNYAAQKHRNQNDTNSFNRFIHSIIPPNLTLYHKCILNAREKSRGHQAARDFIRRAREKRVECTEAKFFYTKVDGGVRTGISSLMNYIFCFNSSMMV